MKFNSGEAEQSIALSRDVTATDTEAGLVLLDGSGGRYWQLNGTGATVLRLLLAGHSPEEAATQLAATAPVTATRATEDVRTLVTALQKAGLVVQR